MRILLSWLLTLGGLTAVGLGATGSWFEDRPAADLPFGDLFSGLSRDTASVPTSMVVPLAIGALVVVVGLFGKRGLALLGGLVLVVSSLGWIARAHEVVSLAELGSGVWNTLFGSLLVLVGAAVKPSRG
ncbi:hypothetical protein [Actinokineospora pegani]|uniref:hypothetical protein n=1 Tax=Actinokineospora pegani TaxID=2654637 RepID=UPI0012EA0ADD|nr:hypothetical protein [Actinokineospora pegani]